MNLLINELDASLLDAEQIVTALVLVLNKHGGKCTLPEQAIILAFKRSDVQQRMGGVHWGSGHTERIIALAAAAGFKLEWSSGGFSIVAWYNNA